MKKKRSLHKIAVMFLFAFMIFGGLNSVQFARAATSVVLSSPSQTESTITLSWTQSEDLSFGNYTIYCSTSSVNGPYLYCTGTTNKTDTSTFLSGLSPNSNYWFFIVDYGDSSYAISYALNVTTSNVPVLQIDSQTGTTASLSWSDFNTYSSLVPFDGYTVQFSTSGSNGSWSTLDTITNPYQTTYTAIGLSPGQTYYFILNDTVGPSGNLQSTYSNIVSVTIAPVVVATISASTTTLDVGQTADFVASASGGTPPYSYQWYVNGSPVQSAVSSSYMYSPASPGTYNIYATVEDSSANKVTSNSLTVTANTALTANITASATAIDVGQQVQFTVLVSGGTPSYDYQWYSDGSPVSTATSASFTFVPGASGTYNIEAGINDTANYQVFSSSINVIVNPQLTADITASKNTTDVGLPANFAALVSGGMPPYSYQWYVDGNPIGSATADSFTYDSLTAGSFGVSFTTEDSSNFSLGSPQVLLTVNSDPTITIFTVIPFSSSLLYYNNQANASVDAIGGSGAYTYYWLLNGILVGITTSPDYTYVFSHMGQQQLQVNVTDSAGYSAASNVSSVNYSYDYLLFGVMAVLVVIVAVALYYVWHRPY